jgi:hypothetical protein
MIHIISITLIVISLAIATYVFISVRKSPILTEESVWLSTEEMGRIEKDLPNCKEVILIADSISVPSQNKYKEIMFALIDNFKEGVEYNFLVDNGFYESNSKTVSKRYQNIIDIAKDMHPSPSSVGTFRLHSWPFKKPEKDYPYLFYRYVSRSGDEQIMAFRGEDAGVGISQYYRRLEPEVAKTILMQALPYIHSKESLSMERERYGNFTSENTDNIVAIDSFKKRRAIGE